MHIGLLEVEMPADLCPSISVLLPVYNGDRWLNESIESVLSQTFVDFELLIIDDGSNDSSLSIIKEYALLDPRVRYLEQENQGLVYTLNRGIRACNGNWIARIDADDLWHPSKLTEQFALIKTAPSTSCVGTGFVVINHQSSLIRTVELASDHKWILDQLITRRTCFPHSSALFRRDMALRLAGYRVTMARAQDTDFWLRLSELGCLAVIPQPLVSIRVHGSQLSSGSGADDHFLYGWLAVVSYYIRLRGCPDPLDSSTSVFLLYKRFIRDALIRTGSFTVRHMKLQLKDCLSGFSLARWISCVKLFCRELFYSPSLLFLLITEARSNHQLAMKLAVEWSRLT